MSFKYIQYPLYLCQICSNFAGVDDSSDGMGSDLEAARYHDFDDEDLEHEQDGDNGEDEVGKDGKGKKKAPRQEDIIVFNEINE